MILLSKIIFTKYLPHAQVSPKTKSAQGWSKFDTLDISNMSISVLMLKTIFHEICTTWKTKVSPKIKNAQNLLKCGTFDFSNTQISILKSKMIFY